MRRLILTASVAIACATMAQPVDAQFQFGVQGAYLTGLEDVSSIPGATDFNGTMGAGGRVVFSPPIPTLSIGLVGQGVYYLPEDGSYMTYGLGAKVGLAFPMISPYIIGGWQWRRSTPDGGTANTETGGTVGAGIQLGMVPVFVEVTTEFNEEIASAPDFDVNPLVIQAGILIGG